MRLGLRIGLIEDRVRVRVRVRARDRVRVRVGVRVRPRPPRTAGRAALPTPCSGG